MVPRERVNMENSQTWFERACRVIPGGVNSPVRTFKAVGGEPLYVVKGSGAHITTVEGRKLVDFCGSWGPLILGHARPEVVAAIQQAVAEGSLPIRALDPLDLNLDAVFQYLTKDHA